MQSASENLRYRFVSLKSKFKCRELILLIIYLFVQSMSKKRNPYDNAVAENFFSCLKCECVHMHHFTTRNAAKPAAFSYIETFYNCIRPHSGIGWLAPNMFERS